MILRPLLVILLFFFVEFGKNYVTYSELYTYCYNKSEGEKNEIRLMDDNNDLGFGLRCY